MKQIDKKCPFFCKGWCIKTQFYEPLMADVSHYFISGMIAVQKNNELKLKWCQNDVWL